MERKYKVTIEGTNGTEIFEVEATIAKLCINYTNAINETSTTSCNLLEQIEQMKEHNKNKIEEEKKLFKEQAILLQKLVLPYKDKINEIFKALEAFEKYKLETKQISWYGGGWIKEYWNSNYCCKKYEGCSVNKPDCVYNYGCYNKHKYTLGSWMAIFVGENGKLLFGNLNRTEKVATLDDMLLLGEYKSKAIMDKAFEALALLPEVLEADYNKIVELITKEKRK